MYVEQGSGKARLKKRATKRNKERVSVILQSDCIVLTGSLFGRRVAMFEDVEQRAMVERENVESGRGGEASDKIAMDFKSEEEKNRKAPKIHTEGTKELSK